ncbi:MAG TPA: L,D-transpeptidase family protein [Acidimicrobiia bacterium]|nr:L,D-transpeptidase family protein [Acidimicrobiia bacterium]
MGSVLAVLAAAGGATYALVLSADTSSAGTPTAQLATSAPSTTHPKPPTTRRPTTTTTTIPPVKNPADVKMPSPGSGLGIGSRGPLVLIYEARMKALHFDPGTVDDYFDQNTQYAVITVQKYFQQPRTGIIDAGVQLALSHFQYAPAEPTSEPDRVEIDLDKQVLTVYQNWQPILLTTTSTGSGEHFCGGVDGCQYAITPTGHYHFYSLYRGWDNGKLGRMWNPYYFNGGIAVHGLESVPTYPASHGCARIPMHIADYFYTLVHHGESVFVVGTPKQRGSGYVGPIRTAPAPPTTPTLPPTPATTGGKPVVPPHKPPPTTVPAHVTTTTKHP